jgi:molybdopterin/thiamine biosynthesis adenylyltransferase
LATLDFASFHTRNLAIATLLQQQHVLIAGAGAIGSTVATCLALMGANVITADPDPLSTANLPRTRADHAYLGVPKGLAVAATIRGLTPEAQRIIGLPYDLLKVPQTEVWNLLQGADAVVAATGSDEADRLLNWICLHRGIPLIVPSMWPEGHEILADLLVIPADQPDRAVGCFECLRPPPRPGGVTAPMLEAQEGLAPEVNMVASVTAMTVLGTLLPNSDPGRELDRLLDLGVGYRIIRRRPFAIAPVRNPRRPDCGVCIALRERRAGPPPGGVARARSPRQPFRDRIRQRFEDFIV